MASAKEREQLGTHHYFSAKRQFFSGRFQHAPAAGMVVAELIADGRTQTEDIHPLRPTRFRENDLIYEPITAFRVNPNFS